MIALVFVVLSILWFKQKGNEQSLVFINSVNLRRKLDGKSWVKHVISNSYRKRNRSNGKFHAGFVCKARVLVFSNSFKLDPFFTLLHSGDIELNPGPGTGPVSSSALKEMEERLMKLFANSVMEIKFGQAVLRENQAELKENQEEMINRLFQIESDMTKMKKDTDILKEQQAVLNDEVEAAKSAIDVVEYKS